MTIKKIVRKEPLTPRQERYVAALKAGLEADKELDAAAEAAAEERKAAEETEKKRRAEAKARGWKEGATHAERHPADEAPPPGYIRVRVDDGSVPTRRFYEVRAGYGEGVRAGYGEGARAKRARKLSAAERTLDLFGEKKP